MKDFYIQWHLTNRCNLRCLHCYQDDFSSKGELPFEKLKIVLDNLTHSMEILNSKLSAALTGGEPFLLKELFKLMEKIEENFYFKDFSIITNGFFIPNYLKELKGFKKLKDLKISIDGFSSQTNDKIRGKGTFKRIVEAIEEARAEKFKVYIMFTVTKLNLDEAKEIIPFIKAYGISGGIIEKFVPLGRGKEIKKEVLDLKDWKRLCSNLLKTMEMELDLKELSPYRAFKIEWHEGNLELFGSECIVGKDGGAIMPSGDFYPCRRLPLSQGNLLKETLYEILKNSPLLKKLKDKKNLNGKCKDCIYNFCIGCRAFVYATEENIYGEDKTCLLIEDGL